MVSFFVAAVIVDHASVNCTGPGGICTSGYLETPVWGVPFELLAVLVAGVISWRITAWLTTSGARVGSPGIAPLVSLTGRERERVLRSAWTGVALVGLSAAVSLVSLRLFWWGCTDECHGYGFVVVGYFFVAFSGGLLLASAASVARGDGVSPFVRLMAVMALVIAILVGAIAAIAFIDFLSGDLATAVFWLAVAWLAVAGVPSAAGLLAWFGVRRRAKESPVRIEPLSQHFGLAQLGLRFSGRMVLVGIGLAFALLSLAVIELPLLLGVPFWLLLVWTIAWIVDRRRTPRRGSVAASDLPEEFRPVVWALVAIVVGFAASLALMLVA